jgi:hypothetical protein
VACRWQCAITALSAAKENEILPDLIPDMAGIGKFSGIPAPIPDLAGNREIGIPDLAGMGGIGNTEIRFGRDREPEFPPRLGCRGFGDFGLRWYREQGLAPARANPGLGAGPGPTASGRSESLLLLLLVVAGPSTQSRCQPECAAEAPCSHGAHFFFESIIYRLRTP